MQRVKSAILAIRMLVFVAVASLAAPVFSESSSAGSAQAGSSPAPVIRESGALVLPALPADFPEAAAELFVRDGKTDQELRLSGAAVRDVRVALDTHGARHTVGVEDGPVSGWLLPRDLQVTARLEPGTAHHLLVLTFANHGAEQRWLETGIRLSLAVDGSWSFWDGFDTVPGSAGLSHANDTLPAVFPAAGLFTPRAGIVLGIEPMQLRSYLRSSVASQDGRNARFEYVTRIVVDPGASETVEFVFATFEGGFGHLEVLQRYADAFPAAFALPEGADPRASLAGTRSSAWNRNEPEMYRRTYSGWEWEYAPFRRTGDIYGYRELWDYTPPVPITGNRALSYQAFHDWRRDVFQRGENSGVAMLFYIPSGIWVEQQLADERYPEAQVREPGVSTTRLQYVTPHDTVRRVFPFGNSYAEVLRADMRRVVEELNMQGFAFDVAGGGVRVYAHNTEGVAKAPGRAYDENGVYVDEAVAIALLMEYARSLTREGRPMMVVSNPAADGVYMTLVRSDAAMFEGAPWGRTHGLRAEHLRSRFGSKTLVWWRGWDHEAELNPEAGPAAMREAFLGKVDYLILKSLELGVLPAGAAFVQGVPSLGRLMPMLVELVQAGWQPVPAIRNAPEGLWLSRYGRGGRSYVAAGNATLDAFSGTLTVDNTYLGEVNYLFTHFDGSALRNTVAGRSTGLEVSIPSRAPFVGRAVLGIEAPGESVVEAVVSQEQDLDQIVTEVVFTLPSPETLAFIVEPPAGYSLARMELNGRAVAGHTGAGSSTGGGTYTEDRNHAKDGDRSEDEPHAAGGMNTFTARVANGDVLRIYYQSDVYRVRRSNLLTFDFISSGTDPQAAVVLSDPPSEGALLAAFRLQRYFSDYIHAWRNNCQGVLAAGGAPLQGRVARIPQIYFGEPGTSWNVVAFTGDFSERVARAAREPFGDRPLVILADNLEGAGAGGVIQLLDDSRTLFVGAGDEAGLVRLVTDLLYQLDAKYRYFGPLAEPLRYEAPQCY